MRQAQPNPTQAADGQHGVKLYRANFIKSLFRPRERPTQVPVQLIVPARDQMEAFATWVESEFGCPDLVINNAGIGIAGAMLDTRPEDWERLLRVNLWSVIDGCRLRPCR
ncbi:short chain dehydrogenase [compost metagenome]